MAARGARLEVRVDGRLGDRSGSLSGAPRAPPILFTPHVLMVARRAAVVPAPKRAGAARPARAAEPSLLRCSGVRPDEAEVTALALAAKAGDAAAAAAFIRATMHDVHRFLSHLADPGEVEDLGQETYLRAMGALPRFDARSSARTWLLSIARRTAADAVRQATRRPRLAASPRWETLAEARGQTATRPFDGDVVLRALLGNVEASRREAFVATQVVGLSYARRPMSAAARSAPSGPGSPGPARTWSRRCGRWRPTRSVGPPPEQPDGGQARRAIGSTTRATSGARTANTRT